jgi:hypothetical protein
MKKFLTLTILSLLLFTANPISVQRADASADSYACILQENTFFYTSPEERGIFLLPATYYVKLLEYGEEYCRIEYLYDGDNVKKLLGYAKTSALTFVEYTPVQPYFSYHFEVRYRIEENGLTDSTFLNEITLTCTYYGDFKIGSETYCYVLRGGTLGYVPKPANLTIPKNTEYEEWVAQQTPTDAPTEPPWQEQEASSPAQIAILIALCLLVPTLAALILKPPRRPPYETDG